jgi:hypothetical protein
VCPPMRRWSSIINNWQSCQTSPSDFPGWIEIGSALRTVHRKYRQ